MFLVGFSVEILLVHFIELNFQNIKILVGKFHIFNKHNKKVWSKKKSDTNSRSKESHKGISEMHTLIFKQVKIFLLTGACVYK